MLLKQFLQFHAGKQPGKIADRSGKGEKCFCPRYFHVTIVCEV